MKGHHRSAREPRWGRYSRHDYHTEVQPVPGVAQEREGPHAEAPCQDLNQRLKRVNAGERVPRNRGKVPDRVEKRTRGMEGDKHTYRQVQHISLATGQEGA